jgi:hypothetical protein
MRTSKLEFPYIVCGDPNERPIYLPEFSDGHHYRFGRLQLVGVTDGIDCPLMQQGSKSA